jgi:hypothetical protein
VIRGRVAATVGMVTVAVFLGACSSGSATSSSAASGSSSSPFVASAGQTGPPASIAPGDPAKVIATADGVAVTEASFNAELNAIGSVPSYLDATDLQLLQSSVATRLPGGGFDPGYVRLLLRRRILFGAVENELSVRGLAVSDVCRQAAATHLSELLSGDATEGAAFLAAFPASYRDQLVVWYSEVKQLQSALSGLPCDTTDPGAQDKIGTAYAAWLDAALGTATIDVDSAYGTWDAASATILPPGGIAATTVPASSSGG